jgi:transcriptional regulator with XRE-family HTH domain
MKNLKELRRDAGLTQYGLARLSGIRRAKISHAELGLAELTPNEIKLVRKIFLDVSAKKSARVLRACSGTDTASTETGKRLRSA